MGVAVLGKRVVGEEPGAASWRAPAAAVLVVGAVLRLVAVIGQQAFVYVDSIDYETLDLSGRSRRPWVTPLLYWITDDTGLRIALQAGVGAACWSYLAVQAAMLAEDRRVRWAILLAILCLSLTTTVTSWDTAMLSESLALSFSALLLGALLRSVRVRTTAAALFAVEVFVVWVFTRQNHVVLGALVLAVALGGVTLAATRRRRPERWLATLAAGLAIVLPIAAVWYRNNTEVLHFNVAMVVGDRVIRDADDTSWFVDHGMPEPSSFEIGASVMPEQVLADPALAEWIATDGTATYVRYLVTHPWDTITDPLDDLVSDRAPFSDPSRADEVLLAGPDSYGVARQVMPEPLEDLLFQPGNAGTIVFALAVILGLTAWRWRTRGPDGRWLVPLIALALQWPALTVVWHASVAELGRLALPSVVIVRVTLLVQLALLVDGWLRDRRPEATGAHEQAMAPRPPRHRPAVHNGVTIRPPAAASGSPSLTHQP